MSDHERHLCSTCLQAEYDEFRHACVHESMAKNKAWEAKFGGFNMPRWDYSYEEQILTFSGDGKPTVICDVITIGTTVGGRWQWSWANRNAIPASREAMKKVFEYGESKEWSSLTDFFRDADEYTGWECAAVTSHLLSGEAVYRFPYGDGGEYFAYLLILRTHRAN